MVMINSTNGTVINPMQLKRINKYPFRIYPADENATGNYIIDNNLESGHIRVYEKLDGISTVQQLTASIGEPANAVLVAEATIGALWQPEGVFIHKINCEHGYENLVRPIIEQIVHFATFYDCYKSVRISERERENWFIYAGGILADFYQKGRTYIYQIR